MAKIVFQDIDRARILLGLEQEATPYEIKKRYRLLAKKFHPDASLKNKPAREKKFKEISWAYDILMDYAARYRLSFTKTTVEAMNVDSLTDRHLKQFYDGWWGRV